MTETPAPSDTPSDYPELDNFFQAKAPLNDTQRSELISAAREAMKSTMTDRWPGSPLAREIRRCVESQRFYPSSLQGDEVARRALIDALNDSQIQPIVYMVWDRVRSARFSDGIAMSG